MATKTPLEVLGIDIGGTGIKAAPVNIKTGKLLAPTHKIHTPKPATPAAIRRAVQEVMDYFSWSNGLGCGYPGVIKNGIARTAVHMDKSWIGTSVMETLQPLTKHSVRVINDADAAGLAELRFGAGRQHNRDDGGVVLMITLGTGIGSAIFYNGILFPNSEFGHFYLRGVEAEQLAAASKREKLKLSWEQWGKRVDRVLKEMEKFITPDLIIVGGGVSENFELFRKYLKVKAPVVPAQMGNDAGIVGAAYAVEYLKKRQL